MRTAAARTSCLAMATASKTPTPSQKANTTVTPPPLLTQTALNKDQCGGKAKYNVATKQCEPFPTVMTAGIGAVPTVAPFCWLGFIGTNCKSTPTPSPKTTVTTTPKVTPKPTHAPDQWCGLLCSDCEYGSAWGSCNPKPTTAPIVATTKGSVTPPVTPKPTLPPGSDCVLIGGGNKNCSDNCPFGYNVWGGTCKPAPTTATTPNPTKPPAAVTSPPTKAPTVPPPTVTPRPTITPIVTTVAINPGTSITPSPSVKPKAPVSCGGAGGATIQEGNVATGEQYGPATAMNDNQRWRCVPNPKNPSEGMWAQCPGCPLTVIPESLGLAKEYTEESAKFQTTVNQAAQDIYICKANGGTQSSCESQVYAKYGITTESQAFQDLAKTQVTSTVKMYEGQDKYFAAREKYDLCTQQQANDANCAGYLQQANNALTSAGIDPTQTESLNESYHNYVVSKASNLYLTAQSAYQNCLDQNTGNTSACSGYQKNVQAALNYPGVTKEDTLAMVERFKDFQTASDILNKPNSAVCGSDPKCDPMKKKQEQIAALGLSASDTDAAMQNWTNNVVYNLQNGVPGIETELCKQLATTTSAASKCGDIASARATIRSAMPSATLGAINEGFAQIDLTKAYIGTDADLLAYYNAHKTDSVFAGVSANAGAIRTALEKQVAPQIVDAVKQQLQQQQATPQSLVAMNPDSEYSSAYEAWKKEQLQQGRSTAGKTEAIWQASFDQAQMDAIEKLRPELEADGKYLSFLADVQAGKVVPTELYDELHPLVAYQPNGRGSIGVTTPTTTTRVGETWLNTVITKTKTSLNNLFGMSEKDAATQAQGYVALLPEETKKTYIAAQNANPEAQAWLKANPGTTTEDYLEHQMQQYYENKPKLEQLGLVRPDDSVSETA